MVAADELAATSIIRSQRFQPIADQAIGLWASLRLQPNVELTKVELSGARNRRRVYLGVEVYGTDTAAVGVASKEKSTASPCRSFFPPGDAS